MYKKEDYYRAYKPHYKWLTVVIFILAVVATILLCSYSSTNREIEWSKDRKLTINDYTIVNHVIDDSIAATTCTGMKLIYDHGRKVYTAIAIFDKTRSLWNISLVKRPQWILNHEQLHFDITNYIAKEYNKRVKFSGLTKREQLFEFDRYDKMLDSIQLKYDFETNHSRDSIQQLEWNKYVNILNNR